MTYAAKSDANQQEIINAFRKMGCTVQSLHRVGQGVPDLLIGFRNQSHIVEVKDGAKKPSAQKLTPPAKKWLDNWRGDYSIVSNIEQVAQLVWKWSHEQG